MKSLSDHLSQYAAYHRDRRNIATHFVGIPMIVLSVIFLLWHPVLGGEGTFFWNPALIAIGLSSLYYLKLDLRFGIAMTLALLLGFWCAKSLVQGQAPSIAWIYGGVLFLVGWIIQAIGHLYEGRKPAFVDDLIGLLIGPLFVMAELAFALKLRLSLLEEITQRSGPTRVKRA